MNSPLDLQIGKTEIHHAQISTVSRGILSRGRALGAIVLCCLVLPGFALGQATRVLRGIVEDTSGEYVEGAEVMLRNALTGQEFSTSSEEEGQFRFTGVALGDYLLIVKAQGFKTAELPVKIGEQTDGPIYVPLQVAAVAQSVVVSARSEPVPVAGQNVDVVELDRHWIENLPTKEGDPLAVPSLFLDPTTSGALGPKIIVDGVESSALEVPLTSIRKVYVNKSPYSAEFGRPGRGRIEVITRKGSRRDYHGNLNVLLRNSELDARNAFARMRPPLQREIAEAELDGPLGKKVRFLLAGRYYLSDESATVHAHTLSGPLVENVGVAEHNTRLFGRFDFELTPQHSLTLSYKFKNKVQSNQGVGGFDLPERGTDYSIHENEVKLFERAILSPTFLNELHLAYKDEPQLTISVSNQQAILVLGAFNSGGAQIMQQERERAGTVQDHASIVWKKHVITFGGGARPRFFHGTDRSNSGGTFTFGNLAAFAAGQPEVFTMNEGNPRISFVQTEYYSFVQDEMQLWQTLSVSLGLRYEGQSNVDAHKNLAPRLALAYAPFGGQTVLRGGFGIFYDRQPEILQQQALLYNGVQGHQVVLTNPGYPVPFDPSSPPPPSLLRIAPGIRDPYLMQASIGLERKLGRGNNFFSIDYTRLRGIRLYRTRNTNAPLPTTGLRPDPNFINLDQFESSGKSQSDSMTVSFRTALRNRLSLLTQYTLARAMDDTSGWSALPANNYDLRPEYGRADYDRLQRLNLIGTCTLPWNLRAGTVLSLSSGIPFNITTGFDNNGDTVPNDRPPGVGRNTGEGPGYASVDFHLSKRFTFSRSQSKGSHVRPAGRSETGSLSTASNESREVSGPRLEIGIDAFNAFNRVNFKNYVGTQSSPFFGRANTANSARQLQISVKFHF